MNKCTFCDKEGTHETVRGKHTFYFCDEHYDPPSRKQIAYINKIQSNIEFDGRNIPRLILTDGDSFRLNKLLSYYRHFDIVPPTKTNYQYIIKFMVGHINQWHFPCSDEIFYVSQDLTYIWRAIKYMKMCKHFCPYGLFLECDYWQDKFKK